MAITDASLLWTETGRPGLMIAALAIDNIATDGYRFALGRQYYRAHGQPIVPRVARLTITGGYNYVLVDLDGTPRTFTRQGIYTLRLAGQQTLTITARTRGNAPARAQIVFYSDDAQFPLASNDVYYRSGTSGEPFILVYNVNTRITGGQWVYAATSTPPFNNGQNVQTAIELRAANTARFDFVDTSFVNGLLSGNVRGYFNGATNTIRNFIPCFGFDENARDLMFSANKDGIVTTNLPPSPYFFSNTNFRLYSDNALKSAKMISTIGGRGAINIAMRPPRNAVNAYEPIGTNTAILTGTLTVEMY